MLVKKNYGEVKPNSECIELIFLQRVVEYFNSLPIDSYDQTITKNVLLTFK
jgi:hypothetical protein